MPTPTLTPPPPTGRVRISGLAHWEPGEYVETTNAGPWSQFVTKPYVPRGIRG